MNITGQYKTVKEFEIDDDCFKELMIEHLYKSFNWKRDWFIEDSKVKITEEFYGSHYFETTDVVREATEEDVKTYDFLKEANKRIQETDLQINF